jgi:uncharacterized protein YyaL (SSP411 family)
MPNRLIEESSPYLLQHAHNPVDWYAWRPEALQKARDENKPIFLSIGYAACHWCHVMERESFEDPETAHLLNEHFVSIKVDREERPDLDSIYMNAVVALTGQGGWPMSVFLTPQGEPFYGGTYFPPVRRHGLPSFREILQAIMQAWTGDNAEVQRVSKELTQHLREASAWQTQAGAASEGGALEPETLEKATQALLASYDWSMGGWGRAPRFPQPMAIDFLLMQATRGSERAPDAERATEAGRALAAAVHALEKMSQGGMYDVVGGGFHRYSTDDAWLAPHFEKMLYDNAQLALAYLHAHLLTGSLAFRRICTETLDFLQREMTGPEGGFYSSLDADSEGEEGRYYVWTKAEIDQALVSEKDRQFFDQVYPLPPQGNFEGKTILQRRAALDSLAAQLEMPVAELIGRLEKIHYALLHARSGRVRPQTDDKVLVSWNALALRAFTEAARYLNHPGYLETARKNAAFLLDALYAQDHLLRSWRGGQTGHAAFLEDHASLVLAMLALYQTDPDPRWYGAAVRLAGDMDRHFRDPQGGFLDTRQEHGDLITRPKDIQDNATPSGNALAASALLHLSAFSESSRWREQAESSLAVLQGVMVRHPTAFAFWLQGLDFAVGPVHQVALIGPRQDLLTGQMLATLWSAYRPRLVVAAAEDGAQDSPALPELLRDRKPLEGKPTAFVCQEFTCKLPVNTLEGLKEQLGG